LEVYQPPSKTSIWANGDTQLNEAPVTAAEEAVPEVAVPEDESDDEYQVISKKPKIAEEPATTSTPIPAEPSTTEVQAEVVEHGDAMEDVQGAPAVEQGPVSDADWLRSRTNRVLELVEDDEAPSTTATPAAVPPKPASQPRAPVEPSPDVVKPQPEAQPSAEEQIDTAAAPDEEDKIRETGRLYLRNLHYEVTEDEIREQFSKHGALEEVSYNSSLLLHAHAMMNIKIGTTDASAPEVTLESILVDVFLI
jgi:multiple RNA-binding domain-containing protein 1